MNPPDHPTPRTDAAWSKTFQDEWNQFFSGNAANKMRDECATLERELTAERDQLRAEVERLKEQLRIESASSAHALHWAEKAEAECLEQARLLGMSGEREADLLGKIERLERELAAMKGKP